LDLSFALHVDHNAKSVYPRAVAEASRSAKHLFSHSITSASATWFFKQRLISIPAASKNRMNPSNRGRT
jgi:hypothetical protein